MKSESEQYNKGYNLAIKRTIKLIEESINDEEALNESISSFMGGVKSYFKKRKREKEANQAEQNYNATKNQRPTLSYDDFDENGNMTDAAKNRISQGKKSISDAKAKSEQARAKADNTSGFSKTSKTIKRREETLKTRKQRQTEAEKIAAKIAELKAAIDDFNSKYSKSETVNGKQKKTGTFFQFVGGGAVAGANFTAIANMCAKWNTKEEATDSKTSSKPAGTVSADNLPALKK